jgi:putative 4-mercaptohistidine N1-methyltranferase
MRRRWTSGVLSGRSSFELARHCRHVLGVDFSKRFIEAASRLAECGSLEYARIDEGNLTTTLKASVPAEIDRTRVRFEVGDAMNPRRDLGSFDVVLMANLIDRLREPALCLSHLASLVKPGGQLILTSPYTWLPEFTPPDNWLGGIQRGDERISTLDGLRQTLDIFFDLKATRDLPFLIREHARKFQLSVAEASVWRRKATSP